MLTVATDDAVGPMLWASRFLLEQGYDVKTILYQDNRSAILAQLLESISDIWKSDFSLSKWPRRQRISPYKVLSTREVGSWLHDKTSLWFKIYYISQHDYEPLISKIIPFIIFNHSECVGSFEKIKKNSCRIFMVQNS